MTHVKKIILLFALILSATCSAAEQNFDTLATTYVEENGAALTLIRMKSNGEIFFAITEASSKSVAFVKYAPKIYNFYLNKDEHGLYSPLMFVLICPEENRGGADENLGVWDENVHMIPVYALFDVLQNGQMIFDAPYFYSGEETLTPSHYHSNITEDVHTRLIKIFMTHMHELHDQVHARNVVLP